MKRIIIFLCFALILIPLLLWGCIVFIGSILPSGIDNVKENLWLSGEPIEGYEIIYPYQFNGHPDTNTFYYLSTKKQVIYRYDENRYLELQGENCEGLIWYHDTKNNIHTRIDELFFTANRLPKYGYFNPGKEYIGIPTHNLDAIMFSYDGGRTFTRGYVSEYAAVPGSEVDRFIGVDNKPIFPYQYQDGYKKKQNQILTGSNGYFILKDNSTIFGYEPLKDEVMRNHSGFGPEFLKKYYSTNSYNKKDVYNALLDLMPHEDLQNNMLILSNFGARYISPEAYGGWNRIQCIVGAEK